MRTEPNKGELVHRIISDRYFEKRNRERKEYLSSRYALGYCELCNKLGIEPEDSYLYEQALAELIMQNRPKII